MMNSRRRTSAERETETGATLSARLKAALTAARVTGDQRYWSMARDAASSFLPYLASRVPGLWLDVQKPDGEILDSPAPASTFYHIVSDISALDDALAVEGHVEAHRPVRRRVAGAELDGGERRRQAARERGR